MSVSHSCLPYGYGVKQKTCTKTQYKKGDRVIIKVYGEITSPATLVRDPYISNLKNECVCVSIDGVTGDKYIQTKEIVGYEKV